MAVRSASTYSPATQAAWRRSPVAAFAWFQPAKAARLRPYLSASQGLPGQPRTALPDARGRSARLFWRVTSLSRIDGFRVSLGALAFAVAGCLIPWGGIVAAQWFFAMWVVGAHSLPTLFGLVFVVAVAIFGAKTRAYPTLSLALLTSLLTVVLRLYRVRHSSVDTDNSYHDRGGALPLPAFVAKPALTLVMSTFNIVALASPAELRGLPQGSVVLAEAGSPAWNISYRMAVPTLLSSLNGWSLRAHTLRHPVGFAWPHYVELAAAQATLSRVVQTVWAQHEVWAQAHGQLADGQVFCVPGVTALSAVRSVPFVSPVETPLFRPMPTVSGNLVKVQAELTKAQPSAALCFVQPERAWALTRGQ